MIAKTSSETLKELLNEMRPLLIVAGVPKEQIRVRDGKLQIETLSKAFDWLHNLKMSPVWSELVKVRKLLPEATWKKYKLYELEGLREIDLLDDASKKVAKLWKSGRPRVFNKNRKTRSNDKKKQN